MESSNTKKSSWKEITDAFHTLKTREEKKTLQNRLLEEVQAFPFAIKGSLQGAFKSLESGTLFQQKALREIYRYTFHPQQAFQEDQTKQRQIQNNLHFVFQQPREFIRNTYQNLKTGLCHKISKFLRAPRAQKMESIGALAPGFTLALVTPGGIQSYEQIAAKLERKVFRRGFVLGFNNKNQFQDFSHRLQNGLLERGIEDANFFIRGSAVTGISFKKRLPFDLGRHSDLDVAISSPTLLKKIKENKARLMSKGTRSAPLDLEKSWGLKNLEQAGLTSLAKELSEKINRNVTLMIYESQDAVIQRGTHFKLGGNP